jgi:hypothetical protein
MIIHGRIQKSKKRKTPKAVQAQHDEWLTSIQNMSTGFSRKPVKTAVKPFVFNQPVFRRETEKIPSKNPHNMAPCTKTADKVYTGDKMIGIGTLHKSNAVPVFRVEDAEDMAKMRR